MQIHYFPPEADPPLAGTIMKCLFLEIGLVSRIVTFSPTAAVLPGLWTRNFLLNFMYFLYFGCITYRSTCTVTVSFMADLTTTPSRNFPSCAVLVELFFVSDIHFYYFFSAVFRDCTSVNICAISLRTFLPSRTFRTRLPAPPKRNTRNASRFSATVRSNSSVLCVLIVSAIIIRFYQ